MRIIKPNFEIWEQEEGLEGIYKQIEKCGRVCYASDPIEGKAKDFVDRMVKLGHGAMLEHGTVYLTIRNYGDSMEDYDHNNFEDKYIKNNYSKIKYGERPQYSSWEEKQKVFQAVYITTNLRVLVQGDYETWDEAQVNNFDKNWLDDLQYLCESTKYHEKRVTVHFTTQIAITREFNRHRVNSMAEQSTRYCDYSGQGKKFEEVGINLPSWINPAIEEEITPDTFANYCKEIHNGDDVLFSDIDYWIFANLACEFSYQGLRRLRWTPQQARVVLPLDTNTQLSHTAFVSDWEHFFALRDDEQHAHPDAFALANPLHQEFRCRGYIV